MQRRRTRRKRSNEYIWIAVGFLGMVAFQSYFIHRVQSTHDQQRSGGAVVTSFLRNSHVLHHETTEESSLTPSDSSFPFSINPVLRHLHISSDEMFSLLLANHPNPTNTNYVLEVGCYSLTQSAFAASQGFQVVSFDASPQNFARMEKEYQALSDDQRKRLELINKAVSDTSGSVLEFSVSGGTGDHVVGVTLDQREHQNKDSNKNALTIETVQVETVALDNVVETILAEPRNSIYMAKIDVQGHEASVIKGLKKSLGKIRYILLEYWVDALDQAKGVPLGTCSGVQDILTPLHKAGYDLFDLSIQMHPQGAFPFINDAHSADFFRPLDPLQHCKWFASRGKQAREERGYQMGYWTDILAVYQNEDFNANEKGHLSLRGRKVLFQGQDYAEIAKMAPNLWNDSEQKRAAEGKKKL